MKILFLTPDFPHPPQQGASIRSYHFIRSMSERHEIAMLSFAENEPYAESFTHMRRFCSMVEIVHAPQHRLGSRLRTLFFSSKPDMAHRKFSPQFAAKLRLLLAAQNFDLVQIENLEMTPYIGDILAIRQGPRPVIVFDDHNVEHLLQRRAWEIDSLNPLHFGEAFYSLLQWMRLMRYERQVLQEVDGVLAVSPADAQILKAMSSQIPVGMIPNGVDISYFQPTAAVDKDALVFVGKMDFRPNVDAVLWFFHHIWPHIKRAKPGVEFWVVGKNPSSRLRLLHRDPQVKITGPVPDVRPYLAQAKVVVIPMRMGSGTRLKVLEAMAMGKAIVSTRLGCEGIEIEPGREVLLAESVGGFAAAIIQLLEDRQTREKLGTAARRLVAEKYDWRTVLPRLEGFYSQLLSGAVDKVDLTNSVAVGTLQNRR